MPALLPGVESLIVKIPHESPPIFLDRCQDSQTDRVLGCRSVGEENRVELYYEPQKLPGECLTRLESLKYGTKEASFAMASKRMEMRKQVEAAEARGSSLDAPKKTKKAARLQCFKLLK